MFIVIRMKRLLVIASMAIVILFIFITAINNDNEPVWNIAEVDTELIDYFTPVIEEIILTRNRAMMENNLELLKPVYNTNTRNGVWAYEHEKKKMQYLYKWADKQGIKFTGIDSVFKVRWAKEQKNKTTVNFCVITDYSYEYLNLPDTPNHMRIATYHVIDLSVGIEGWEISREWYTDPFADSLSLDNLKAADNREYIMSQSGRDFSSINSRRIEAVEYADRYCGASDNEEYFFLYNKKYKNYNGLGGDCANFASQVLHEGGKFKKTGTWNYEKDGSRAWLNAQGFKDYLLYSGRGSLIARGTYDQVLKLSYKLLPGDIVGYEKKGKVVHVSVVTGADSRGYTLINCHNTDRFRVPWDLGWSDKGIKFWLIRVNY
ncbi:MAG TPA: amidase domain-containing protein [Ruminiclostridium sp.]|jgi:hypothetical protein|nr:amidase domain-containing protein [Clostridiaceae bacterium]HAA25995.1 amidase domain-containing protein [Ruminiclostridium sp.]